MLTNKNKTYGMFLMAATIIAALLLMRLCAPTCYDGETNGNETDVDCGGKCPPCIDSLYVLPLNCYNGIIDKGDGETGIDCGGKCPACPPINCKTAEIEISKKPQCNERVFKCNLPDSCNPTWRFNPGDIKKTGHEVTQIFTSNNTYTATLYADNVKISEENFDIECPTEGVAKPTDAIEKPGETISTPEMIEGVDEIHVDGSNPCPSCPSPTVDNCKKIPNINKIGNLICGEEITFTCDICPDCNIAWDLGDGIKQYVEQITTRFQHANEYTITLHVGIYSYEEKFTISCDTSPLSPPETNDCNMDNLSPKTIGENTCNKDIIFTCDVSTDCNVYWIFDTGEKKDGIEVKYQFDSGGSRSFKLYVGDKFVTGNIDISCPISPSIVTANCEDGIKNQDEKYIDCGGSCPPCPPSLEEENMRLRDDLQSIAEEIYNGGEPPLKRRYRRIARNIGQSCEEDILVNVNGIRSTLYEYILKNLNDNTIINTVSIEKDGDCVKQIIIWYRERY